MTTTPTTHRIIAREPDEHRWRILANLSDGQNLYVEHAYSRNLRDANVLVGVALGVASTTTGGTSDPWIIQTGIGELVVVPAAHVLRVRMYDPETAEPGMVLAGPPVQEADHA